MAPEDDTQRELGVVEAITLVRDRCPHGAVREHAATALDKLGQGGAAALREQAFLVLSTLAGWRGARAEQVKRSLRGFLERTDRGAPSP
jgi:hypothetical protein